MPTLDQKKKQTATAAAAATKMAAWHKICRPYKMNNDKSDAKIIGARQSQPM